MDHELFLSENKWLSLFFWQEFEIRNKPDCLGKRGSTLENTTSYEILEENHNNLINDRLSGSFYSVNTSSLSKNDPTHEYKEFRNLVKSYMQIFKEHVFDPDHPINKIVKVFIKAFTNHINEEMKELLSIKGNMSESLKNITDHRVNLIIKQLQSFILKLQTCLRLMYSKTLSYSCFVEEKDEFINLITNLIFRDEKLYSRVIQVYKVLLQEKLYLLECNFNNLKDIQPEDLSLNEKYCLNETTKKYQQKIMEEYKSKMLEKRKEREIETSRKTYEFD